MPGKKRFVDSDILNRNDMLFAREVDYAVDQQKRKTMRQNLLDLGNIQRGLFWLGRLGDRVSCMGHSSLASAKIILYSASLRFGGSESTFLWRRESYKNS
jgi:hypothetical protein